MEDNILKDKKFGIVFAGGGAKGAYQIGALKALKELGITDKICGISGTSIGGISLALTMGSTVEKSWEAWKSFKGEDFVELDDNGFDPAKYGDGIFTRESLLKIIEDNVDFDKIVNSEIPLYVTVCFKNYDDKPAVKYVKLNGLEVDVIKKYLMATSAIPVVYDHVDIDGTLYYDGGLLDNTPIMPLYGDGISDIIVISNDYQYENDNYNYPGANIVDVIPSASLDMDTLIGTADLDSGHSIFRLMLGYYDTKAIVGAYLQGVKVSDISGNKMLAQNAMRINNADRNTNQTIDNLNGLLNRYGIKL